MCGSWIFHTPAADGHPAPARRPTGPREELCERLALRDLGRVLQLCAPVRPRQLGDDVDLPSDPMNNASADAWARRLPSASPPGVIQPREARAVEVSLRAAGPEV